MLQIWWFLLWRNDVLWLLLDMQWVHLFMMRRSVVFGKVISAITFTRMQANEELTLVDTISHPEQSHIHIFELFLFNIIGNYPNSVLVINFYWCWWLYVDHFDQFHVNKDICCWQLLNTVPISASVDDDIRLSVMEHMVWTAPFQDGVGSLFRVSLSVVDGCRGSISIASRHNDVEIILASSSRASFRHW